MSSSPSEKGTAGKPEIIDLTKSESKAETIDLTKSEPLQSRGTKKHGNEGKLSSSATAKEVGKEDAAATRKDDNTVPDYLPQPLGASATTASTPKDVEGSVKEAGRNVATVTSTGDGAGPEDFPEPSGTTLFTQKDDEVSFFLRREPVAKSRPGESRSGHRYNRNRGEEEAFKSEAKAQLKKENPNLSMPAFPLDKAVAVHWVFGTKRPQEDFVNKGRGREPKRLKEGKREKLAVPNLTGDVDNFCKLAMDAVKKVLYNDDIQVVYMTALKVPDTTESCEGYVSCRARSIASDEIRDLLRDPLCRNEPWRSGVLGLSRVTWPSSLAS